MSEIVKWIRDNQYTIELYPDKVLFITSKLRRRNDGTFKVEESTRTFRFRYATNYGTAIKYVDAIAKDMDNYSIHPVSNELKDWLADYVATYMANKMRSKVG